MSICLYSPGLTDEVKVSGVLGEVVRLCAPASRVNATEFLTKLETVERTFFASPAWQEFVASGTRQRYDDFAQGGPVAISRSNPTWWLWSEDRRLRQARALAEHAAARGSDVCWS